MENLNDKQYLSYYSAARVLNIHQATLKKAIERGEVKSHHFEKYKGRDREMYDMDELHAWLYNRPSVKDEQKMYINKAMLFAAVKELPKINYPGTEGIEAWDNLGYKGNLVHISNGVRSEHISILQAFFHNRGEFFRVFKKWELEGANELGIRLED